MKECAPSPRHTSLDSKPSCILGSGEVWPWRLSGCPARIQSTGRRQAGSKGGEGWNLWEGHRRPRAVPSCSPNTRMFLPEGSLDLARVDTSLKIEDLWRQCQERSARDRPGPLAPPLPVNVCPRYRPSRPTLCPATPPVALYVPHHRLWPSSSSLVRSPAAATAGPLGPSSSFFSTPTGAILPTAATKRALPRAGRGPARTPAGPRRPPAQSQKLR